MKKGVLLIIEVALLFLALIFVLTVLFGNDQKSTGLAIMDTCVEDDGGIDFTVKGTVTWNSDSNLTDYCEENLYYLTEYFCNSTNDVLMINYSCFLGCNDGACNTNNVCTETDGGENYGVNGTTTGRNITNPNLNASATDYCINNNSIMEYFCGGAQNDYLTNKSLNCPLGCINGTCEIASACLSNWSCANWSVCSNNTKIRSCTDLNICNSSMVNKNETQTCSMSGCVQNWSCGDWSQCVGDNQIRTCNDLNFCENVSGQPAVVKNCGPQCTPDWSCGKWAPEKCSANELQKRTCVDMNSCNLNSGKPSESQTCKSETNTGTIFILVLIVVITLTLGDLALLIALWRKMQYEDGKFFGKSQ